MLQLIMKNNVLDRNGLTEEQFLGKYDPTIYPKGPYIAVDNLLFAIDELQSNNIRKLNKKRLQVLLVKRESHPFLGRWSLPGTFPSWTETLEEACIRSLKLKSHLENIHLEQLYTFSDPNRDPRTRIVATAYMALVNKSDYEHAELGDNASWFTLSQDGEEIKLSNGDEVLVSGDIAFDHAKIIQYGLARLRNKIEYTDIAFSLLPKQFTLAELQQVYEIILDKEYSKANFQRKISDRVEPLQEYHKGGFRPALLYTHKK